MRATRSCAIAITLTQMSACMMPVGGSNRPATASARSDRPRPEESARNDPESAARLCVREETLTVDDIWDGDWDELRSTAGSMPPSAVRLYVENHSAQRITDKLAESLLFQHAAARLPTELRDRIDGFVDEEIGNVIAAEHGGIERRYERSVEKQGRTSAEVRAERRRAVMISGYLEREIKPKLDEPTREELYAAYESERSNWTRSERRRMSLIDARIEAHLDSSTTEPTRTQWETARSAARAAIDAARAELARGEEFGSVARRHSNGLHAADGGAWGWLDRQSVRERFAPAVDALYTLGTGAVSDVIESIDGYFLVRCDEIEPAMNARFEDVQPALRQRLMVEQLNRRITELVAELRDQSGIAPATLERFHGAVVEVVLQRLAAAGPNEPPPPG